MKIEKATIDDAEFIKSIYKQHKKEIGNFNLFWVWDKYLEGNTPYKFVVIKNVAFMRFGYSKKFKCNVLYEIGVDNKTMQKGAGKMLYNYLPKPTMIKCNTDNIIGNKFYEKMGAILVGKTITKSGIKQQIWWNT